MDENLLKIPRHIGYIVDGNRRWAKKHSIPSYEGHLAGYNTLKDIVKASVDRGVEYISAYVFSTENWRRSKDEVKGLMSLITGLLTNDLKEFQKNNIRLLVLGSRDGLEKKIIKAIEKAEAETKDNTAGTAALCFNYGGQLEIADAVKKIIKKGYKEDEITPELISENVYYPEVPPVDLVVRTSGEQRISNFMLWSEAYSELFFYNKLWPDMKVEDVDLIIKEYNDRSRRFGK